MLRNQMKKIIKGETQKYRRNSVKKWRTVKMKIIFWNDKVYGRGNTMTFKNVVGKNKEVIRKEENIIEGSKQCFKDLLCEKDASYKKDEQKKQVWK